MAHLQKIYLITLYPKTAAVAREVDDNFQKNRFFFACGSQTVDKTGTI
jgi:hypothetical protein